MSSPPTAQQTGAQFFQRIPQLQGSADVRALYDEWAASYDADLTAASQAYLGPAAVARAVLEATGAGASGQLDDGAVVLDAGCGTGLSGVQLRQAGARTIDGIDLSPEMLRRAKDTGVYRTLTPADLSTSLDLPDATYDVVTCVGTLTQGHVGPVPALAEFVRVLKSGGIVAATIREDVWEDGGYRAEVDRLAERGVVEVVSTDSALYRAGGKAKILVLRKK